MTDRTALVIAHRLSAVKGADRIVVMREGDARRAHHRRGMPRGSAFPKGHYAELYNTYFRHQSLEYKEGFAKKDA